jgi:DNA uptake protein ComE-like DNA-binding protein/endonuclease YncB( thermonuclease family)
VNRRVAIVVIAILSAALESSFSSSSENPSASAARASWTVLNNCVYVSKQTNDGDSFYVSMSGRLYLFRLYFVDAPETDFDFKERVDEQAKHFGISNGDVIRAGKAAKDFVREKLGQPFTVRTCFQNAPGSSRMQRLYAIVQTPTGDLGEQLIENGLARIQDARANPVGLPSANEEWQKLKQLETSAKEERVGAWGVNFGRIMARSEKSKNRAPVDPFEAFFHSEEIAGATAPQEGPLSPSRPAPSTDNIVSINPDHTGADMTAKKQMLGRANDGERPGPQPIGTIVNDNKPTTVNINTATQKQLESLPGVGPVLAQRVIAARPYKTADELRNVKGIGLARYQKLRPFFE